MGDTRNAMDPELRSAAMAHYEELARIGKAVSSGARLRILDLLRQAPRAVEALADEAGLTLANASQHLQHLKAARLVESEKDGQRVVYRLRSEGVDIFFVALRGVAEELLPEMQQLRSRLSVQSDEERAALVTRAQDKRVTLLDVRPVAEFAAEHIPGAQSIPLPELEARIDELPRSREVLAYCRGPYCPMAISAVALLERHGYRARHLDLAPADVRRPPQKHRRSA